MDKKVVVVEPLRIRLLAAQYLRELLQLVGVPVLDDAEVKESKHVRSKSADAPDY